MVNSYKIIEYLCARKGIKPGRLCADIGMSRGILSDLKAGRTKELSTPNIQKIANYFNVSTDIFNDGVFEETLPNNADIELLNDIASKFDLQRFAAPGKPVRRGVRIPVFGAVAAGIPIEAIEDIVDYEEIEPELAATGDFFGLRIKGSSMEPRICEGDVVIVRKQEDANTGDVAIVLVNGYDATCKKIKKEAHGLTLIPLNPSYEIKHYSPDEIASLPVRVIGKVVELRGKF